MINFVDRQALSVLLPIIRDTFHLSNTQYGTIGASGSTDVPRPKLFNNKALWRSSVATVVRTRPSSAGAAPV